ncbi:MAG: hypothetical protein HQ559_00505, partial [Lentisphaerae bacterium]|nr:hypothetical protein [Lentisphaerota bacterium]
MSDDFLKRILRERPHDIEDRLKKWGRTDEFFLRQLHDWFGNFGSKEKELALKVLLNVDYYSPENYRHTLEQRGKRILQLLDQEGIKDPTIHLVTTTEQDDSSHMHGYSLAKVWHLPQSQILTVDDVSKLKCQGQVFVFFNDTHGSGNQFVRTVYPEISHIVDSNVVLVAAIAIAKEALVLFKKELPGITVIPDVPCPSAKDAPFTPAEMETLEKIGKSVYPPHPLGYGRTALLTAYFFQCPNNSLPILWADGTNNGGAPWTPLFPYNPKTKDCDAPGRKRRVPGGVRPPVPQRRLLSILIVLCVLAAIGLVAAAFLPVVRGRNEAGLIRGRQRGPVSSLDRGVHVASSPNAPAENALVEQESDGARGTTLPRVVHVAATGPDTDAVEGTAPPTRSAAVSGTSPAKSGPEAITHAIALSVDPASAPSTGEPAHLEYDLAAVRQLITAAFTDDEFGNLVHEVFPAVYDTFTEGMTRAQKIRNLLE